MSLSIALRLAASVALVGLSASAEGVFFDNGNTDWKIFLSPQAGPTERYAAQELQRALKAISDTDFEIATAARVPESRAIIIGALDDPHVRANAAKLNLSPNKVEQVAVHTLGGQLYLAGNQPRGALYAVCSFLQRQLGVRWLWPGPSGEFIPSMARWTLPALAWTHDSLLVKWICHDPQIGSLRARAANRDGEVAADDSVELVLSDAINGKTSHFLLNAKGIRQDYRGVRDGTREDQWNPDWQAAARIATNRWEADLVIPFSSLGQTPNPNETRLVRFLRHNGGRDDFAPAAFPVGRTAVLSFSGAARTDRPLVWWCGAPERESRRAAALNQAFTEAGWQFNRVTTPEALFAAHEQCRVFWFRHPNGPNRVPADYWEESLAPAVRNGALAVFASYWNIPLETYFGDPSFKVKVVTTGKVPLAGRRTVFLAPGDWSSKPNNLLRRLRTKITPAYGFVPDDPAAWTVLATAPRSAGAPYPYLLTRPYGKGTVILCGDNIPISTVQMLENFVEYHEKRQKHE